MPREILNDVCQSLEKIPAEYKKILILADLTILYRPSIHKKPESALNRESNG